MALPTHVEMFVLVSLLCVCLFMFFMTREVARLDRGISQVVGQQEVLQGHVDLLATHVTTWTARLDILSHKHDLHAAAIEKMEWETTQDEEDEGDEEDQDEGQDGADEEDEAEDEDVDEEDDQTSLQMQSLLAHIDSIRLASEKQHDRLLPTMTHILEEGTSPKEGKSPKDSCTITECVMPHPDVVIQAVPSTPPDLKQVKAILKANHVDCRGNSETLMKRFAALQLSTAPASAPP